MPPQRRSTTQTTYDFVLREVVPYLDPRQMAMDAEQGIKHDPDKRWYEFVAFWPPNFDSAIEENTLPPGTYLVFSTAGQLTYEAGMTEPKGFKLSDKFVKPQPEAPPPVKIKRVG